MAGYCDNFSMIDGGDEFKAFPGLKGDDGTTFYPHVSAEGVLSWTNDGGKPNPDPVNIKGTDGTSAYQAAVEAGFSGTEAEFNEYLSGIGDLTEEVAQQKSAIATKAGALVETASGAIASFVPDSTIDDLLGVSVDIEPVQDLHGYDSPWPAGGGKNKYDHATMGRVVGTGVTKTTKGFTLAPMASGQNPQICNMNFAWSTDATVIVISFDIWASEDSARITLDGQPDALYMTGTAFADKGIFPTTTKQRISYAGNILNGTTLFRLFRTDSQNKATTATIYIENIQFEFSASATDFAPYSNICPISGWSEVGIGATSINVWDEELEVGYIYNGRPYSSNDYKRSKNFVSVVPGATYYLCGFANDGQINFFDKAKAYKFALDFPSNRTLTVPDGCYFIKFYNPTSAYDTPHSINYPATDTTYHPYAGTTYTITIGQTVYGGTLDVTTGVLTITQVKMQHSFALPTRQEKGRWVLGFYPKNILSTLFGKQRAVSEPPLKNLFRASNLPIINEGNLTSADSASVSFYGHNAGVEIRPRFLASQFSAEEAQTIASAMEFVYPINPITITLDPVTISTISGQTNNVWADAGDVDVTYAADIKAYIDRMNQPTEDDMIANTLIEANKYFTVNNRLFLSTASIAAGAQIIPGTNCTETSLAAALNALNA